MNPKKKSLREILEKCNRVERIPTGDIIAGVKSVVEIKGFDIDQALSAIEAHYKSRIPQCKFYYIDEKEYSCCNHSAREVSLSSGRKDCPDISTGCPLYKELLVADKSRWLSEEETRKAIEKEITEMQELVDDMEASPEMRSNARSYIRGVKKVYAIFKAQEEKDK